MENQMNLKIINDELIMISFPPNEGDIIPYNAYVFHKGNRGILLDTSTFNHSADLKKKLDELKIEIEGVIFSHYHSDHIGGYSKMLNSEIIIGSERYDEMLSCYEELENSEKYIPTHQVSDSMLNMDIGGFDVKCFKTPGHSPCSISIIVDDKYLHVGDIIINTENQESILPLAYYELLDEHFESLNKISDYMNLHWICGHGIIDQDINSKEKLIRSQRGYLQKVQSSNGDISIEDALKDSEITYEKLYWHERNFPDDDE